MKYIFVKQTQAANLHKVIYLAICFMILFIAYSSAQSLAGQMYRQLGYGNLGQMCLFTTFSLAAVTNIFSTHIKNTVPLRLGLIVSALCCSSFILSGAFTAYCYKQNSHEGLCDPTVIYIMNIAIAALVGIGGSPIWIFQATYVNACASENVKGFYNGLFISILQSSGASGSILAAVVLGNADQLVFYIVLLMFAVSSIFMFFFVTSPLNFQSVPSVQTENEPLKKTLSNFFQTLKNREYRFFLVGVMYSGVAIGCTIAFLANVIAFTLESESRNVINKSISYVFLLMSVGSIVSGLTIGRLADKFDKIKLFKITMLINAVALAFTVLACVFRSYICTLICGILWGCGDSGIQTMIGAVIGSLFKGKTELFCAYRFIQRQGYMYSALVAALVPKEIPLIYLAVVTGTLIVLYLIFEKLLSERELMTKNKLLVDEEGPAIELKMLSSV